MIDAIQWRKPNVLILDQTRLPGEEIYIETNEYRVVGEAIRSLRIRGAPAIGVAGAFGCVVGAGMLLESGDQTVASVQDSLQTIMRELRETRPTANNLFWAVDRMTGVLEHSAGETLSALYDAWEREAVSIYHEEEALSRRMGEHGAILIPDQATVMTHCNTGGLATVGIGTALGVIRTAHVQGKRVKVYADETRPLLQGARLTAWELVQEGIDVTVICDGAAASVMGREPISGVFVGADRIAANGDVANKIGTFHLAVAAGYHHIPFYVVAPHSTFDLRLTSGESIPIEERGDQEITVQNGRRMVPEGARVYNPAFDVTPHTLVTAIITDAGIFYPPYGDWPGLEKP